MLRPLLSPRAGRPRPTSHVFTQEVGHSHSFIPAIVGTVRRYETSLVSLVSLDLLSPVSPASLPPATPVCSMFRDIAMAVLVLARLRGCGVRRCGSNQHLDAFRDSIVPRNLIAHRGARTPGTPGMPGSSDLGICRNGYNRCTRCNSEHAGTI